MKEKRECQYCGIDITGNDPGNEFCCEDCETEYNIAKILGDIPYRKIESHTDMKFNPTWRYWTMLADREYSAAECIKIQERQGYHPAGYSFENFKAEKLDNLEYRMTWKCYASCD